MTQENNDSQSKTEHKNGFISNLNTEHDIEEYKYYICENMKLFTLNNCKKIQLILEDNYEIDKAIQCANDVRVDLNRLSENTIIEIYNYTHKTVNNLN